VQFTFISQGGNVWYTMMKWRLTQCHSRQKTKQ